MIFARALCIYHLNRLISTATMLQEAMFYPSSLNSVADSKIKHVDWKHHSPDIFRNTKIKTAFSVLALQLSATDYLNLLYFDNMDSTTLPNTVATAEVNLRDFDHVPARLLSNAIGLLKEDHVDDDINRLNKTFNVLNNWKPP